MERTDLDVLEESIPCPARCSSEGREGYDRGRIACRLCGGTGAKVENGMFAAANTSSIFSIPMIFPRRAFTSPSANCLPVISSSSTRIEQPAPSCKSGRDLMNII
ncbi:hypothetical protein AAFF_G00129190 [Aldrovandia affinis]|uniref:Uncharacterized protein n=1 Tax=Aldrovandia affinis TaxID=143900 RepID=A0AAD7T1C7_9TELE|nr:hypothetical protein AAFF_G00129190 [Aldrovandia affinis]